MALDELTRQRALDSYRVVDSFPEAEYDDIVRIASIVCDAPTALISLIDRDRQWFKARTGFELSQGSRDEAFCAHAIRTPGEMMEIANAGADPRFADNPLVTGPTAIRFYAGMPLVAPCGSPVGTVCVIDQTPRQLNERQKAALAALSRLTMSLLNGRRREIEAERAALFAGEAVNAAAPAKDSNLCSVAIFEVQDLAGAAQRLGDRSIGRALRQLEQGLEGALRAGSGDSVNHSTGSAEMIVLLHGADTSQALASLRERIPAFERETSLRVLHAVAHSEIPGENLAAVFLRADAALSDAKDAERGMARAA